MLPGLKILRRQISQRRMQSLPVVDRLDECLDRRFRLGPVAVSLTFHFFSLQRAHEAFRHRVVPRTAGPAHGRLNAGSFTQTRDVIATGILHALIRMMDQVRLSLRDDCHMAMAQRRQRQFGAKNVHATPNQQRAR